MNPSPWRIRPAQPADAAPLAAIATAVLPQSPWQNSRTLKQAIRQANGRFWTITHRQQPIGFALLSPIPGLPGFFELAGGIAPPFQRQGAGTYLWQQMRQDLAGTAVRQIGHTVSRLDSPAARFLLKYGFHLEFEEWTLRLADLAATDLPKPPPLTGRLQQVSRETAVNTLPTLYQRCFAGTPWHQPYSAAEVAATWEPSDRLLTLVTDDAPLGFAWLHFPHTGECEIEPIGIVAEKQGQGYGRFLLTKTLQQLQQEGIQAVSLGVWASNQAAVVLYQKMGFHYVASLYGLSCAID